MLAVHLRVGAVNEAESKSPQTKLICMGGTTPQSKESSSFTYVEAHMSHRLHHNLLQVVLSVYLSTKIKSMTHISDSRIVPWFDEWEGLGSEESRCRLYCSWMRSGL